MIGPLYTFQGQEWSSSMRETSSITTLLKDSVEFTDETLKFKVLEKDTTLGYFLIISRLKSGPIRFICECKSPHFSPSQEDSIINQNNILSLETIESLNVNEKESRIEMKYKDIIIVVYINPFYIDFINNDGKLMMSINKKSTFMPSKNSFDCSFHSIQNRKLNFIGLPARSSHVFLAPTILNDKVISDPYRIFNCDTGEFRPSKEFSVYGAINFLQNEESALFLSNSSDTFVDLIEFNKGKYDSTISHFQCECGPIDVFIFFGNRLTTTSQFTHLTGPTFFPSFSNFGFGHCKWGIDSQKTVESIIDLYDKSNIPFDTFWLDIDHLKSNQPFTVNSDKFPDFNGLIDKLAKYGRNLAIILDPHLPYNKGHEIADECVSKGYCVQNKDHVAFVGHCWPGPSIYPDFLEQEVRSWWGDKVPTNLSLWNDMNEPSVFESVEVTMPRNNLHLNISSKMSTTMKPLEHRCVHNVYGHFHALASYNGIINHSNRRPFILTRSYFAGTSRHSAVWTGDSPSSLEDLKISIHQVSTASVCGMPFIGADIGGFFGSPTKSFLELWFINGIWIYPFLRVHAHIESKSRHDDIASSNVIRTALLERYSFAPYWYTLFYRCHTEYEMAVRFAFIDYPEIANEYESFIFIGDSLMVVPLYDESLKSIEIEIPDLFMNKWISLRDFKLIKKHNVILSSLPLFIKRGKIVPQFINPTISISTTRSSKICLLIAIDDNNYAEGNLFLDDGESRNYEKGDFIYCKFKYENGKLTNEKINANSPQNAKNDLILSSRIGSITILTGNDVFKHEDLDIKVSEHFEISL